MDKAVCISLYVNALGKGIYPPAIVEYLCRLGTLSFVMQRKENFELKPAKIYLNVDLVSNSAHGRLIRKYMLQLPADLTWK